nr:hypothetical protein [candidate division Zixibacteria bacterium]
MQIHLTDSTASQRGGLCTNKRLFKVASGPYAGRMIVLLHTAPNEIYLSWADYPYTAWSQPATVCGDNADSPFDAVMDPDGHIYLVYTLETNKTLVVRKLTFTGGLWLAGAANTVYNADENHYPSITIQPSGRLWVAWSRQASGSCYINAKSSDDQGETWGTGPDSYGYAISAELSSGYSQIIVFGSYVYLFFTQDDLKLSYCRKHINVSTWEDEADVATGTGFDENFRAAVSDDNRLGIVFDDTWLKFREFDGDKWGGIITVDDDGGVFPRLQYRDNQPFIIYLAVSGSNQNKILFSRRQGTTFSDPAPLDPARSEFEKVLCYNATSASYADLTSAAADSTPGDILHPDSQAILKNSGDVLYLGMSARFNYLKIILSSVGSGGEIGWQYYNGREWYGFVPSGGACHFNDLDRELLLWDDSLNIPADWQKYTVQGNNLFWVRAVVQSDFDPGPVGSQLTTVTNTESLILMEP